MNNKIVEYADFIINTNKTLRVSAKELGISKSTLHRYLSSKLKSIDYEKYLLVKKIFFEHNKIRHINGGISTKKKYKK